jgi:hypothetical protein
MPCFFSECDTGGELRRFGAAFAGVYAYHFVADKVLITPFVNWLIRARWLTPDKRDKCRESLYKNAAVGAFFLLGLSVGWDQDWFFNPAGYFTDFPFEAPENLRWYYMIYLSFWFQSVDFMLNLTNNHYKVKRKDNAEMLVHHFATIALMVFSYYFDLTKIGICVLMLHDVNDLLLETAKFFVYLEHETLANLWFGLFALVWFIVRWYFFATNIIKSVYYEAYDLIVRHILDAGVFHGIDGPIWYYVWCGFFSFLTLLLVLHIYWGVLIVKMVVKALGDGNVEKDIRSDSEDEDEDDKKASRSGDDSDSKPATPTSDGKPKRRRAPKAE